jgi:signal transduction histidine kinase
MDGYALYEAVRARPEWTPIPFIFLTAKAEKDDVLKGKMMGAEDYITKPFDHEELLVAVQARLERAQAIREATESEFEGLKQQIVNVLSHELRTPLTYIQGYTSLALEDVHTLSPTSLQGYLRSVKHGADRLTRLIDDLLLLIRLDTGQAEKEFHLLNHMHNDLDAIVERTVQQYADQAEARGVSLDHYAAPDIPPLSLCKPFFVDALGRLVDNGIKFTRERGKRVTVSSRVANDWVEITVQDEGVGIPADEIPHLFERFRQIDREKLEQQGVGLGLAIARDLVRFHGGDIAVQSQPQQGSAFTIRLPLGGAEID